MVLIEEDREILDGTGVERRRTSGRVGRLIRHLARLRLLLTERPSDAVDGHEARIAVHRQ